MEIIALSGYARTGKDEAAKVLVEEFGYTRVAFADKLREVLYALNPMVEGVGRMSDDPTFVQDVIKEYGWDGYKETTWKDEIRRLLQRLGTEAGRQTMWDGIWVDAAFANQPDDARIVVTDCRFENEANAVTQRGGKVWRVNRSGVGPINNHISETGLDEYAFDVIINNDSTLEAFREKIRRIA